MSDDLLERATAALRDTTSTPADDAARQRAKLLAQAAKRSKPTPIWQWAAVAFGGLFVSTAMAQLGGYMPTILRALTHEEAPSAAPAHNAKKSSTGRSPQPSAAAPENAPVLPTPSAAEPPAPPTALDAPQPSAALPVGPARAKAARPALAPKHAPASVPVQSEPAPTPASEPATQPEPSAAEAASTPAIRPPPSAAKPNAPAARAPESAELALFRRAQKLHLAHSPDALVAWDAYLRVAKQGALVPEARYNRALCLVWLRRYNEARAALEPFAAGTFAGYRQREAKALLARIPE